MGTVKMDALDAKSVSSVPPAPEDALLTALRQLARSAPGDEAPAIRSVLRHDTAIGQLVRHFPGPVWFDRRQPHQRLPRGRHVSAFASALIEAGERAAPHLSGLLVHTNADIRFYAALTVQNAPHDDHVRPLARLVLDRDRGVRRAALQALAAHARLPSYERVLGQLRSTAVEVETPQSWRVRAMEALATLGDVRALDELIECLGDRDRAIGRAAHAALRELTRHDLGTMRRAWRRWAKAHGRRPRVSWLIDALADRRDDLRAAAFRELAELSGETFGCTPDADRKAHAEAQDAFARWWQTRGAR
ncbi:MAG: hypothetical protein CMN31_19730 [Sandaracinus sp.]|nr:hypothetical protein [Sandaracinus sp.]